MLRGLSTSLSQIYFDFCKICTIAVYLVKGEIQGLWESVALCVFYSAIGVPVTILPAYIQMSYLYEY